VWRAQIFASSKYEFRLLLSALSIERFSCWSGVERYVVAALLDDKHTNIVFASKFANEDFLLDFLCCGRHAGCERRCRTATIVSNCRTSYMHFSLSVICCAVFCSIARPLRDKTKKKMRAKFLALALTLFFFFSRSGKEEDSHQRKSERQTAP
jgi:hypothetical protein